MGKRNPLGLYEKAMPADLSWKERLDAANELGFDFVEMSVDEADHRLARLEWTKQERKDFVSMVLDSPVRVPTMCLSGHRRFPLGHHDDAIRNKGLEIMQQAIDLASDVGIRTIQLAGYDIYYEAGNAHTRQRFFEGLEAATEMASKAHVMLAMEIMDYPLMNSVSRFLRYQEEIASPWFCVYPDLGNLSAWGNDVPEELLLGLEYTVGVHLKDTLAVTGERQGTFKNVPFGAGCVDFASFFNLMSEVEYRGTYLIEMWDDGSPDWKKRIQAAKDFLAGEAQKGGYDLC